MVSIMEIGEPQAKFFGGCNTFESFFTGGPGGMKGNMGEHEEMDIDLDQMMEGFGGGNMGG
jgi:hypothetical protein